MAVLVEGWNGKKLSMTLVENILTYCEEVKEHEPCFARFRWKLVVLGLDAWKCCLRHLHRRSFNRSRSVLTSFSVLQIATVFKAAAGELLHIHIYLNIHTCYGFLYWLIQQKSVNISHCLLKHTTIVHIHTLQHCNWSEKQKKKKKEDGNDKLFFLILYCTHHRIQRTPLKT